MASSDNLCTVLHYLLDHVAHGTQEDHDRISGLIDGRDETTKKENRREDAH